MSFFSTDRYTSGITQFLTQLKKDNPDMENEQLAGHNLLRNQPPRTADDISREKIGRIK